MFRPTRRELLSNALKAGTVAGLADLAFLHHLPPVSAADAKVTPKVVQLSPDIEPLVRLVEETPREKLLNAVVGKIHSGTGYGQLLSALLLAGVRGIKPRPVGFKFHAVLVVYSAHQAALAAPDTDRWLPLLWALDNFKSSQARNRTESGGWMMPPVDEAKLPPSTQAKRRFIEAMDSWDEEGADAAIASLVRSASATEVIELFWRYGARDFRDIGHKAIYAANAWRTLATIGWRHAEPVMRSLAFALLEHEGTNPAQRDDERDRPWRENLRRAAKIRGDWPHGKVDATASADLLAALRTATPSDASEKVVELLNRGIDPASVWDGLFLRCGELLMQQPGIGGLHTVTTMNALHHAFTMSGNDETRRMLMLQGAAFLPLFRNFMAGRGPLNDKLKIDSLEKLDLKATGAAAIEEVLADISKDKLRAARKTLALLATQPGMPEGLMTGARRLVFAKGADSHDYKFSSAALEDYYHATPAWRNRFLATSVFWLRGSGDRDNDLIKQARAALA
jgi:hypothetical protein